MAAISQLKGAQIAHMLASLGGEFSGGRSWGAQQLMSTTSAQIEQALIDEERKRQRKKRQKARKWKYGPIGAEVIPEKLDPLADVAIAMATGGTSTMTNLATSAATQGTVGAQPGVFERVGRWGGGKIAGAWGRRRQPKGEGLDPLFRQPATGPWSPSYTPPQTDVTAQSEWFKTAPTEAESRGRKWGGRIGQALGEGLSTYAEQRADRYEEPRGGIGRAYGLTPEAVRAGGARELRREETQEMVSLERDKMVQRETEAEKRYGREIALEEIRQKNRERTAKMQPWTQAADTTRQIPTDEGLVSIKTGPSAAGELAREKFEFGKVLPGPIGPGPQASPQARVDLGGPEGIFTVPGRPEMSIVRDAAGRPYAGTLTEEGLFIEKARTPPGFELTPGDIVEGEAGPYEAVKTDATGTTLRFIGGQAAGPSTAQAPQAGVQPAPGAAPPAFVPPGPGIPSAGDYGVMDRVLAQQFFPVIEGLLSRLGESVEKIRKALMPVDSLTKQPIPNVPGMISVLTRLTEDETYGEDVPIPPEVKAQAAQALSGLLALRTSLDTGYQTGESPIQTVDAYRRREEQELNRLIGGE